MNIITGKNLISNTVAQVRANMRVVHSILNNDDVVVGEESTTGAALMAA